MYQKSSSEISLKVSLAVNIFNGSSSSQWCGRHNLEGIKGKISETFGSCRIKLIRGLLPKIEKQRMAKPLKKLDGSFRETGMAINLFI